MFAELDIHDLLILIREGKKEGFDYLYSKYGGLLYGVICRIINDKSTAENLLEMTFVYIYKNVDQYKVDNSFFGWLVQNARCVCNRHSENNPEEEKGTVIDRILLRRCSHNAAVDDRNNRRETVIKEMRENLKVVRNSV